MPVFAPELTQSTELPLFTARGQTVVLDSDLARLYGVSTKVFNQAIRRNDMRFPSDFRFQLTPEEWAGLRTQIVTLKPAGRGEHREYRPLAFTEHGAIMAATLLNSPRAVAMLRAVRSGGTFDDFGDELATSFHILGLAPNAAGLIPSFQVSTPSPAPP